MHNGCRIERNNKAHNEDKEATSNGQKSFSANIHKLIVTIPRQCSAYNDEENSDKGSFYTQQERMTRGQSYGSAP
jgi:hypothetical protein